MHRYTNEEKDFLKNNVKGRSYKEITQLFNKEFMLELPVSTVMSACFRYGFKNGIDTRLYSGYEPTQFKKGNVPYNKGTKGLTGANVTSFKKGNIPLNHKPVGSERITVDGYVEVKIAEPSKWRMKHVYVWESEYGPVPKGHVVLFADGNKLNITLDNLVLVSRKQLLVMNKMGLIYNDANMTKRGAVIAEITVKVRERKVRRK